MPPSGYSQQDVQKITAFLRACADALEAEGVALAQGPSDALNREIAGIDSILERHAREPFALHTLGLTRAFYARILSHDPRSFAEFRVLIPRVVEEINSEIASVHVEAAS